MFCKFEVVMSLLNRCFILSSPTARLLFFPRLLQLVKKNLVIGVVPSKCELLVDLNYCYNFPFSISPSS